MRGLAGFSVTVGSRAVGMVGGGVGAGFFAGLEESLGIFVFYSCVVIGLYLCFLLLVCVLGFFEDVDEVFTLLKLEELDVGKDQHTVLTTFPDLLMIVIVSMMRFFGVGY